MLADKQRCKNIKSWLELNHFFLFSYVSALCPKALDFPPLLLCNTFTFFSACVARFEGKSKLTVAQAKVIKIEFITNPKFPGIPRERYRRPRTNPETGTKNRGPTRCKKLIIIISVVYQPSAIQRCVSKNQLLYVKENTKLRSFFFVLKGVHFK